MDKLLKISLAAIATSIMTHLFFLLGLTHNFQGFTDFGPRVMFVISWIPSFALLIASIVCLVKNDIKNCVVLSISSAFAPFILIPFIRFEGWLF